MSAEEKLRRLTASAPASRQDLWQRLIEALGARRLVEVGVFRGEFAAAVLAECAGIERYYMVDPWRHLEGWDKPLNLSDEQLAAAFAETVQRTAPWERKRVILRGTTTEVVDGIADGGLDLAYVDGDHTLRGIAIDLMRWYSKVRPGGWLGGDDFCPSIWQHASGYEPSMVFPFAVYFAEAMGVPIFALPHDQFLIEKRPGAGFQFCDLTGRYPDTGLRGQLTPGDDQS